MLDWLSTTRQSQGELTGVWLYVYVLKSDKIYCRIMFASRIESIQFVYDIN
jgi:hypothetical protein